MSVPGKYILPSFTSQPRARAKSTTLPSLSRKSKFFAFEIGSEGYALSEQDAISDRIVPMRTCTHPQIPISTTAKPFACSSVCEGGKPYLGENAILLTGRPLTLRRPPHAIIAALHQPLLQLDRILHKDVLLQPLPVPVRDRRLQTLQQRVKARVIALTEQQQQIQACDFAFLRAVVGEGGGGQVVEGLQLLEVAREGGGVLQADGDEGAELERLARQGEGVCRGGGGGDERVELEEGQLGFGEEGGRFVVVVAAERVVELFEQGGEVFFGHFEEVDGDFL